MTDAMGTDERRWLFALSRGRLSGQAIARNMPEAVRDALLAGGLVGWDDDSLGLTARGRELLEQLRATSRTAEAPAAAPAASNAKPPVQDAETLQLQWLQDALSRRFRGELVSWGTIPVAVRAPLEEKGLIWRYEDTVEINLSAVRALAQRGIQWRPV